MKRVVHAVAIAILIALALVGVVAPKVQQARLEPPRDSGSGSPVLFEVKPGSSAGAVARQLAQEGLIRNAKAFGAMLKQKGWDQKLKPGMYRIERGRHSEEIARQLVEHNTLQVKVTIPEGLTLKAIAERVEKAGRTEGGQWLPRARKIEEAATGRLAEKVIGVKVPAPTAEGYLFPATYTFQAGASAEQVVTRLLEEFGRRFARRYAGEIRASELSVHELVTLASIVEREAAAGPERPLIAQVFLNRLARGQRLESCATVQYALPAHKGRLLTADTRIDSPYNTYRHAGLPPGPICSPGDASLAAAVHPEKTDALYFVSRGDGTHIFSRTFAQHEAAIRQVRRK